MLNFNKKVHKMDNCKNKMVKNIMPAYALSLARHGGSINVQNSSVGPTLRTPLFPRFVLNPFCG